MSIGKVDEVTIWCHTDIKTHTYSWQDKHGLVGSWGWSVKWQRIDPYGSSEICVFYNTGKRNRVALRRLAIIQVKRCNTIVDK